MRAIVYRATSQLKAGKQKKRRAQAALSLGCDWSILFAILNCAVRFSATAARRILRWRIDIFPNGLFRFDVL